MSHNVDHILEGAESSLLVNGVNIHVQEVQRGASDLKYGPSHRAIESLDVLSGTSVHGQDTSAFAVEPLLNYFVPVDF